MIETHLHYKYSRMGEDELLAEASHLEEYFHDYARLGYTHLAAEYKKRLDYVSNLLWVD